MTRQHNMRIALIHPKFGFPGGAERYATGLSRELSGRSHDIHLFGRRFKGDFQGMARHRVPAIPLGRGIKTWSFWKFTDWMVNAGHFDVVQGFGKTTCQTVHRTGGGTHAAFMKHQGKKDLSFYDRVVLHIEDRLFSSPHLKLIICPSQWVAQEVLKQYPRLSAKLEVVPNGVDSDLFTPEGRTHDREALVSRLAIDCRRWIVLLVATNFQLKGLDTAIQILAHVDGADLVVAGGDDPAPYVSLANKRGVANRVHFLGLQTDMAELYRAADVLIHPTRYDPFANVCLESCACGTPVATTRQNGFSDLLDDRRGGVIFSQDIDYVGVARLIKDLLQKGIKGRESARALSLENDIRMHVAAVERLYRQHALWPVSKKDSTA